MTSPDVIRAWKDVAYRHSLSAEAQAQLPEHPAGSLVLATQEADANVGVTSTTTWNCAQTYVPNCYTDGPVCNTDASICTSRHGCW